MELRCITCGKELYGQQKKYCSKKCRKSAYYHKNKGNINKEERKIYYKEWCKKNSEKIKQQKIKYYAKPKVKKHRTLIRKEWKKNNPEKYKARLRIINQNYHLRRDKIFSLYNHKCARCGYDKILDIHHINENGKKDRDYNKAMKEYIVLCPNCHALVTRGYLTKQDILPYQR